MISMIIIIIPVQVSSIRWNNNLWAILVDDCTLIIIIIIIIIIIKRITRIIIIIEIVMAYYAGKGMVCLSHRIPIIIVIIYLLLWLLSLFWLQLLA